MSAWLELLRPSIQSISKQLLNAPVDVHSQICTRALVRACANGDAELLDWLLTQQRGQVDLKHAVDEDGCPALVLAVLNGRGDFVRLLIEAGCDVHASDASGWTALHWSAHSLDLPTCLYLLNRGADTEQRSFKGLRPADLIKSGPEGDTLRDILQAAEESRSGQHPLPSFRSNAEVTKKKLDLAHESARQLQVNVESLGLTPLISGLKSPIPASLS
jgi:ankyrin repeat protein